MPDAPQFKRGYKACLNCRKRKIRCLFDDTDPPSTKCQRCRRENRECEIPKGTKRGGIQNVLAGRARRRREELIKEQLKTHAGLSSSDVWGERELYNSADALQLLSQLAKSFPKAELQVEQQVEEPPFSRLPPGDTVPLEDTEMVREGLLTPDEARELVRFFMAHMAPFYPFVPSEYSTADKIAAMPILLATITCLAVRYYIPENDPTPMESELYSRRATAHLALWEYCQRLLSQTVWTEASTKSVATVIAFLLLTEWNPTAVHLHYVDYASVPNEHRGEDWLGLGASRRSDRMSWLLLGQAVRLAQDIGLMDASPSLYLAMHTSEIVLACRLGRSPMLSKFLHDPLPPLLKFTREQVAQIEVLQIMALAHETLYASRTATRDLVKSGRYIFLLNMLVPYLDRWREKYADMLHGDSVFTEDIIFGYNHTRLYVFSLALMPADGGSSIQNFAMLRPSVRFVELAIDAAKNVVGAATRLHAKGALRFMPIRWVMRLIHAIVFLVKSLLLSAPVFQKETPTEILVMIKNAAMMLFDVGPDPYHVCRHYGTVLLNLCAQVSHDTEGGGQAAPSLASPVPEFAHPGSPRQSASPAPRSEASGSEDLTENGFAPVSLLPLCDDPLAIDETMTFGMDIDFLMGHEDFVGNAIEQLRRD